MPMCVSVLKGSMVLFCPISELEQGEGGSASLRQEPKRGKKKAGKSEVTAPSSDQRDSSLHVDDLEDPPLSPAPDSHSSMDE